MHPLTSLRKVFISFFEENVLFSETFYFSFFENDFVQWLCGAYKNVSVVLLGFLRIALCGICLSNLNICTVFDLHTKSVVFVCFFGALHLLIQLFNYLFRGLTADEFVDEVVNIRIPELDSLIQTGVLEVNNIDIKCAEGVFLYLS